MAHSLSSTDPSLTRVFRLMMVLEASLIACLKRPSLVIALGEVWYPESCEKRCSTRDGKRECSMQKEGMGLQSPIFFLGREREKESALYCETPYWIDKRPCNPNACRVDERNVDYNTPYQFERAPAHFRRCGPLGRVLEG
eukprot:5426927-Heterocapsa_arctica.AAC.2